MSSRVNNYPIKKINSNNKKITRNKKFTVNRQFKDILNEKVKNKSNSINVSAHAKKRLSERNINLNKKDLQTLEKAMDKVNKKGGKEALLLYKDTAFITSIKNKTVITALDKESSKEDVFTNIDSAMIID